LVAALSGTTLNSTLALLEVQLLSWPGTWTKRTSAAFSHAEDARFIAATTSARRLLNAVLTQ
jgi:hypothetical protein